MRDNQDEDESLKSLIKGYHKLCYTYKEIFHLLQKEHSIFISFRKLERIIKSMNLKRKNVLESPIEDIITAATIEKNCCGQGLRYRAMWKRLRDKYNLIVK